MYYGFWDEYNDRNCCDYNPCRCKEMENERRERERVKWCLTPECQVRLPVQGLCRRCKIKPDAYRMTPEDQFSVQK
jgi:hypothetical protein